MAQKQEGIEDSVVDYYDIMIIGKTGQGKSTTADKLLIANPTRIDYSKSQPPEEHNEKAGTLKVEDISMWLLSEDREAAETRLKFLSFCRMQKKPHEEVNKTRKNDPRKGPAVLASTRACGVISNDTSKVRVLDVPGFFDGESVKSPTSPVKENAGSVLDNNLDIMRKIVHVQTALRMKFRRILYFLPVRGPLERADAILKLDLQLMAHYFGKHILQCMVVVATISPHMSKLLIDESEKFPEEEIEITKALFKQALNDVFPQPATEEEIQVPPIIFISLTDSCEAILSKVKEAPVACDNLKLEFNPSICADCGVKVGVVKGEKVACCFGEDWSAAIPYTESTCHPVLIPKYSRFDRFKGGVVHVVTFGWARGKKWPVFEGEVCAGCREEPGKPGCMQVRGKPFKPRKGDSITVDHTNKMTEVEVNHADGGSNTQVENQDPQPKSESSREQVNPHFDGEAAANQTPQ